MRKVAEIIINVLTICVFVLLAIMIFAKVKMMISKKDYFEVFGYSVFNVATGSMEPTIKQNDIIVVQMNAKYDVDDIITFEKDGSYITHRVVTINDNNIITKGDANNANDLAINKNAVLGKVVKVYADAGIWQKILTSPKVIILIFLTLILFDFAFSYKGFKKEKKEPKESKLPKIAKLTKVSKEESKDKIDINKISKDELEAIYEKVVSVKNDEEKKELEYTIGLDLASIQKEIKSKLDKDKQ